MDLTLQAPPKPKIYSPIVINDSLNSTYEEDVLICKGPSKSGNVSKNDMHNFFIHYKYLKLWFHLIISDNIIVKDVRLTL